MTRKKPGPKTHLMNGTQRRRTGTWDDHTDRMLLAVGGGNRSEGVRRAAAVAYERLQHSKEN